jgi:hypothetical protein
MRDNTLLILLLLASIVWFIWLQLKNSKKRREWAAEEERKQKAVQKEREERAKRNAEEAERQRKAAEDAAWRKEVAEDKRKRDAEKEKVRIEHQQERAAKQEQEKRDRQAAAQQQAAEAEAKRRAEAESARLRQIKENAQRQAEEERARQQGRVDAARRLVEDERASIRATVIASDIQRDMREFLSNSQFFGEEHSPLAYVGYKVGRTHGLPTQERRRRLRACFQIEIPPQLAAKYQAWGAPVTSQRFTSMCQHITMLADMRRQRPNYEVAVSDWEADVQWLAAEYGSLVQRLHNARIG